MCGVIIDWPSWIQAIAAIATLFIGGLTFLSQRKIKTLTEVVQNLNSIVASLSEQTRELQNQTGVLSSRYDLEKKVSLRDRFPDFEVTNFFYNTMNSMWSIELMNEGLFATHFIVDRESKNIVDKRIIDYKDINETKKLTILLKIAELEMSRLEFDFRLMYKNGNGVFMDQKIFCFQGHITIVPQMDHV